MARIAGKITNKVKLIDAKKLAKKIVDVDDDFEKEWREGFTIEEARTHLYKTIEDLEWNKKN